jgi:1-acyl-sn-glycerol-3-phosphate acyltransferase
MIPVLFTIWYFSKTTVILYFLVNYFLAAFIYHKASKCYFPHMKFTEKEKEGWRSKHPNEPKSQYYHDQYPAFSRIEHSQLSFGWIYFGVLNYLWIKMSLGIFCMLALYARLKLKFRNRNLNAEFSKEDREFVKEVVGKWTTLMYKSFGISVNEIDNSINQSVILVYRKFLGPDYKPNNEVYSTIIANHLSWAEIMYLNSKTAASFVAKASAKKAALIGFISQTLKTIYLDRTSKENREAAMNAMNERQQAVMEGRSFFPLALYPEGTTTNGRKIIEFKKGAFHSLTPIKPFIMKVGDKGFPLAASAMSIPIHMMLSLTFFKCHLIAIELPVFAPNEYLFKNFQHIGKDNVEIYANALREVMSVIAKIPRSHSSFETKLEYISEMKRKVVKNT